MPKKLRKNKKKEPFFKRVFKYLFLGSCLLVLFVFLAYYVVLPSVFFNKKESRNILIVSDNLDEQSNYILLAHTSNNLDDNFVIFINGKQVIDVGEGYGNYSLNTVYKLLKIDNKSNQKIKSMFSGIFNIVIDDVVVVDSIDVNSFGNKELKNLFSDNLIKRAVDFPSNKINLLKLHFLSNNMNIFKFDSVDELQSIYYKLSTIDENIYQDCSVSVVNSTDENGLAHKISEIIENTGFQVMQVEGSDFVVKQTTVYYPTDKEECQQIANKISKIFSTKAILSSSENIPVNQQFRSNIVVMIGTDY